MPLQTLATTSYAYDWQNHLVQVNQNGSLTQFAYDGDGKLAQRIDPSGTLTDYVGDLYEKAIPTGTATPTETKRYYLGSMLVATNGGGATSYVHQDYLHSTVSTTSTTTVEYTPYGQVRTHSGTLPTDRQFQGQQNQAGVGLYHMGARWYDPTIGLWTQPDTVVPSPLDPLALNRYSFVEGNPLRYTDPSGHTNDSTQCQPADPSCQGNPQGSAGNTSTSGTQQPQGGQSPCDLMPLACKPVGNYAVWVYVCLASDCEWYYVPIPGAIPPPDVGSDVGQSADDLGSNSDATGPFRASSSDAAARRAGQLELPGFKDVERAPLSGAMERHHTIPTQILRLLSDKLRKAVQGKRGAPNILDISKELHRDIHNGENGGPYNAEWRRQLDSLRISKDPADWSVQDILAIRDDIVGQFGLGR